MRDEANLGSASQAAPQSASMSNCQRRNHDHRPRPSCSTRFTAVPSPVRIPAAHSTESAMASAQTSTRQHHATPGRRTRLSPTARSSGRTRPSASLLRCFRIPDRRERRPRRAPAVPAKGWANRRIPSEIPLLPGSTKVGHFAAWEQPRLAFGRASHGLQIADVHRGRRSRLGRMLSTTPSCRREPSSRR